MYTKLKKDMSFHGHDENINKIMRSQIEADSKKDKGVCLSKEQIENQEIERDFHMLELMPQYKIKDTRFLAHILKVEDKTKALSMLENYINGRIGSAILHYDSRYVLKNHNNDFTL